MNKDNSQNNELSEHDIEIFLNKKFKLVYSQQLGRKVYVLNEWIEKPVFKRHKKLFGYCDIGWTVKHPKKLSRALIKEGVWNVDG